MRRIKYQKEQSHRQLRARSWKQLFEKSIATKSAIIVNRAARIVIYRCKNVAILIGSMGSQFHPATETVETDVITVSGSSISSASSSFEWLPLHIPIRFNSTLRKVLLVSPPAASTRHPPSALPVPDPVSSSTPRCSLAHEGPLRVSFLSELCQHPLVANWTRLLDEY